jgi:retinol dehydrogenase-12
MVPPMNHFTAQGYDLKFGTNVLGHYLLTKLLLPTLQATAASISATDPVRIVEFSSSAHFITPNTGANLICYETLKGESRTRSLMGDLALYSQSKSANILLAKAHARLLAGHNIISLSVHPGAQMVHTFHPIYSFISNRAHRIGIASF